MGLPVKLSDDLVKDARREAEAADRSLTSQIEHWARLGRNVERVLRHEDMLDLKRTGDAPAHPPTRRAILTALRRIATGGAHTGLGAALREGRTVYQDAGDGRLERIESDGTRTVGRLVKGRFTADESQRVARRR